MVFLVAKLGRFDVGGEFLVAEVDGNGFGLAIVFIGAGWWGVETIMTVENKGKVIEVKVVKIVYTFGSFGPGGVDAYPNTKFLVVVLWPGVEDISVDVSWFDFGIVGKGITFNLSGRNAFGSG